MVVTTAGGSATLAEGFTYIAPPGSFTLTAPADGADGVSGLGLPPKLYWSSSYGQTGYLVEIATDASFKRIGKTTE